MAVETRGSGTTPVRRRRTLEPYLLKVQEVLRREARESTRTRNLAIDGFSLSVEPWVRDCVESQDDASGHGSDRDELLRHSLALWLKSALDVRELRREIQGGSANLYEAQSRLMLDSAFGTALLQELQRCVDRFVQVGNLEEAKRLSKFRNQVTGLVRELKQLIAESNALAEFEIVPPQEELNTDSAPAARTKEQLSATSAPATRSKEGLSATSAPATRGKEDLNANSAPATRSIVEEPVPKRQAPRQRPRPPQPKPAVVEPAATAGSYRTPILVVLNIVALVAWIVFVLPSQMRDKPPRALSAHSFENATPLVEIAARPPALYATVDQKTWSEFDPKQQRRFIDSMGNVLLTNGYWGLLLKSSDGRLVGAWYETGGTRLLKSGPAVPAARDQAVSGGYSRFIP